MKKGAVSPASDQLRHSRPESSSHRDTVLRVVDDNPRQSQIVVMKTERGYFPVDVPYPQRWLRVAASGG